MCDFELNYLLVLICLERKISVEIIKQIYINNYLIKSWLKDILIYSLATYFKFLFLVLYFFLEYSRKDKSDTCIYVYLNLKRDTIDLTFQSQQQSYWCVSKN